MPITLEGVRIPITYSKEHAISPSIVYFNSHDDDFRCSYLISSCFGYLKPTYQGSSTKPLTCLELCFRMEGGYVIFVVVSNSENTSNVHILEMLD